MIYDPQPATKPIVLTLFLGSANQNNNNIHYGREGLLLYINGFSEFPSFKLVVILGQDDKVKAYITSNRLKNILSIYNKNHSHSNHGHESKIFNDEICRRFIRAVNEGHISELIGIPGIVTTTVNRNITNIEALKIMDDQELEILVVVDNNESLSGLIERGQFIDKIFNRIILKME